MSLVLGLLLLAVVAWQWFTQEVAFRFWTVWRLSFHREEWPAFYWIVMALETGLALLCVYLFFT
jgi:hypothetical protein